MPASFDPSPEPLPLHGGADPSSWLLGVREPDAALHSIPEAAIQDVWAQQAFALDNLHTTDGESVRIHNPGTANAYGGPDFLGADIEIGGLRWAGDVEIHRTSREWESHRHHLDPTYDRVVLHVVLGADRKTGTLRRADGSVLPEVILLPHLDQSLHSLLRSFLVGTREPPYCAPRWPDVPPEIASAWVRSLGTERLREKARALGHAYGRRPDLCLLLLSKVFRALGYSTNEVLMETLATLLPCERVRALDDPADTLALVLGLAGWLSEPELFSDDDARLAERFNRLNESLGLKPIPRASWRSGGRPANAPRRRLAQAAALIAPGGLLHTHDPVEHLSDALRGGRNVVLDLLRPHPVDGSPRLGANRAEAILVNAVLPVLLLDAEMRGDVTLGERVMAATASLPAPADHITQRFAEAGFVAQNALDAQGLYRLSQEYCTGGRCGRCDIGRTLYPGLRGPEEPATLSAAA